MNSTNHIILTRGIAMAYSLNTAWLRERKKGAQLTQVAIGNMRLRTLFRNYKTGFIVLSNPALTKLQKVDLVDLQKLNLPLSDLTFNNWLTSLGSLAIESVEYIPDPTDVEKTAVTLVDAFAMGLVVDAVHDTYNPEVMVDGLLKTSLWIKSEQETFSVKHNRFCVAVNGFLHRKERLEPGIRVKSGRRTFDQSGFENLSLISFNDIGNVAEIGFVDNTINPTNNVSLDRSVLLELGTSLVGKSVLLSFVGILHGEHDIVTIIDRNSGIIKVDLYKLDLLKVLLITQNYIDLSSLDINAPDPYDEAIMRDRLSLDRVIKALFKLDQTFAIVVDVETLDVTYDMPLDLGLYGKYNEDRNFKSLLVDSYGRLMPYRKFKEGNIVAFAVGIDHYEYPASKRALDNEVGLSNSNAWWGDKLRTWARFMNISSG